MGVVICFQSVILCLQCNSGEPHGPANSFAACGRYFFCPNFVYRLTSSNLLSILFPALLEELMTRLRVFYHTVASRHDCPSIFRSLLALLVSFSLLTTPVWAAPSSSLGTLVYADRAHVGSAQASVGATVFSGDRLSTDQTGSAQVRAGSARLLLSGSSIATLSHEAASPAATLIMGSATFSTANSKAFSLHVSSPVITPNTDHPTIPQVTILNPTH